ncbi:aromatic alcohol reductase [Agrobacterium tumefaciens]|uniref:aromatic alcohol reductase n=1 Tax=Agrobacterium tumefaciens TaxID=358 RepID=UPI00287E3378|nr:aromatic alcohol reductase [Agrobacterium tumefaciens]MDS7595433.1 aromatic alcohol reductase [Agrobacterium tumefaciens]
MTTNSVSTEKILVLGAGELGLAVLRELVPALGKKERPVTVLIPPRFLADPKPHHVQALGELATLGVTLLPFDMAEANIGALTALFSKFDTVINCTGFVAGPGTQVKITRAVLNAGVRRYFPWQFGVDYDVVGKGSGQPVFDEQFEVRKILREQDQTEWVIVSTGMFTSFLFEPSFGVVDLENGIVSALGSWETQVTVTTPRDIGRLTTAIFLHQPRIANEVVYIAGDTISYGRLADVIEEALGRQITRRELTLPQLHEQLARRPEDVMQRYRTAFAKGDGMWWDFLKTYNYENDIETQDVRSWLNAQLARPTDAAA